MPEFMYLLSYTIHLKYKGKTSKVTVKYNINNPSKAAGKTIKGKLTKAYYYKYAKNIIKFIKKYNKAPNYVNTKIGYMQYQTTIFMLVKILKWSNTNSGKLPSAVSLSVKSSHSINKNLPKYTRTVVKSASLLTMSQIFEASNRVKNYIETNNAIPTTVAINGASYSINDFLYLVAKAIVNKNNGVSSGISVLSTKAPGSSSGNNSLGQIQKSEYIILAQSLVSYFETHKQAPNFISTSLGNLQYQSTIYVFARIGAYIYSNNALANYVDVTVNSSSKINGGSGSTTGSTTGSSSSTTIVSLAASLTSSCTTELQKATAIYNWVSNNIDYEFYYNTIRGAAKTLSDRKGNCVDQSHLLVALFRAAGLTAQYVNGKATFSSGVIGHTWVRVKVNGAWLIADTTSSRNTLGNVVNWKNPVIYGYYDSISF